MEIAYLGHSSFKIRPKNVTLVTDPFNSESVGLPFPKVEADIVTVSHNHEDHNQTGQVGGNPFIISGPGEYEVKEVLIFGLASFHDSSRGSARGKNTIYLIEAEGMRLCHLGDLGHKLDAEQLEEINGVDVLFLPVGGVYTLDPAEASAVVSQIEPKIVIPMHFQVKGLNPAVYGKLATAEDFLKEMGEKAEILSKLVINREKLPEERQIIILERKG